MINRPANVSVIDDSTRMYICLISAYCGIANELLLSGNTDERVRN